MRFEEQVRARLIELTARDGFVEVEQLIGWSANNLLVNAPPVWAWPERLVVEAVLKAAFEYFVFGALEYEDDKSLDEVFFLGEEDVQHAYVIRTGDENGKKLAQAHHANRVGAAPKVQ